MRNYSTRFSRCLAISTALSQGHDFDGLIDLDVDKFINSKMGLVKKIKHRQYELAILKPRNWEAARFEGIWLSLLG
jgi:hypothetical protein